MRAIRAEITAGGGKFGWNYRFLGDTNAPHRAHCIGANHSTATSLLRQDYKEDIGLEEALELAVKVLSKTMDSTTLDHEKGMLRYLP